MVIDKLKNKSGSTMIIWLIIISLVFISLSAFLIDFANLYSNNKKVKSSVNFAVKAASLQIKENEELADGVFKIDETKAYDVFIKILAHNLNLNELTLEPLENCILYDKPLIKEFKVINDIPGTYESEVLNNQYELENPSVFAVVEFKTVTIFLEGKIVVDKLSSSQLSTIYD